MDSGTMVSLVRAAQAGDGAAFGTLARELQKLVFAILHQYRPPPDEIEDLAQETFLRAFRQLPRLRDPQRFLAWLTGIAINVVREARRTRARHSGVPGVPADPATAADGDPATRFEREQIDRLLEAVQRLPARYRLPLTLFYLDGCDYHQVATQLGISEGAARVRLCRARDRLRRRLRR